MGRAVTPPHPAPTPPKGPQPTPPRRSPACKAGRGGRPRPSPLGGVPSPSLFCRGCRSWFCPHAAPWLYSSDERDRYLWAVIRGVPSHACDPASTATSAQLWRAEP
jgi:hypothetical protein